MRRTEGSPAGPLELLIGQVVGVDEMDVQASAIAAVRNRDLVIVQDRTYSFREEFDQAIIADLALVEVVEGRPLVQATISRGEPVYATERAHFTRTRELVATA